MNITMKVINHKDQRYNTVGDWQFIWNGEPNNELIIKVSDLGNWDMSFLLMFHELVEAHLCDFHNITQEQVDEFDMSHPELDEPGEDPRAPYHKEHMVADAFEQMMAVHLNVDWNEYSEKVGNLIPGRKYPAGKINIKSIEAYNLIKKTQDVLNSAHKLEIDDLMAENSSLKLQVKHLNERLEHFTGIK